jgi:hypothetical protein
MCVLACGELAWSLLCSPADAEGYRGEVSHGVRNTRLDRQRTLRTIIPGTSVVKLGLHACISNQPRNLTRFEICRDSVPACMEAGQSPLNNHTKTTQWDRPLPPAPVAHAATPAPADAPSAAAAPSATDDDTPAPITPRLLEFLASLTGYLHLERSYERSQFEHSRRDSSSAKMKKLKRKVERSKPSAVLVPITEEDESIVRSRIFTAGMPEVLPASNFTIKVVEKKGSPRGGDKTARPKDKDGGCELKTIDATSPAKSAASAAQSSPVIRTSEPSTTRTSTPSSAAGSTPPRDRKSLDELSEGSSSTCSSFHRWVRWRAISSPTTWPLSGR